MPIFKSIFWDMILVDPKWIQSAAGAASNAVVNVTIPAFVNSAPHILLIAAGFSDGVTSQVMTITQVGLPQSPFNITVAGLSGVSLLPPFLTQLQVNAIVTISLPASGVVGVIGYVHVLFRIS